MKTRWIVALAAVLAGAPLIAGAAQQTLVYCSEGSPSGFNPELYTDGTTFDATRQIYDQQVAGSTPVASSIILKGFSKVSR